MNKFKKILLGTLSILTLGLFVSTVNATDLQISFTYTAYTDTMQTTAGGSTNISNVSNGEVTGWYNPEAVSNVSVASEYYVSYASASKGKITKIGNSSDALVTNIPSKYKANITITAANTVGYVCAMSPIEGLDKISFNIQNSKGNDGETFVLVTSDGTNYYQYGSTQSTKSLNLTETITLAQLNSTLETAGVDVTDNIAMGYAVILTSTGNIWTESGKWTTTYYKTIQTDATTYDVKFYDVHNNELTDLAKSIAENEKVSEPTAPIVFGKQFKYWAIESADGEAYDFTQKVTSDLNLYAVYDAYDTDNYSLTVDYIKYAGDYYGTGNITADKPLTPTKYTFVNGTQTKNNFTSDAKSVGTYGNSTYAIKTAGSVQADGGSSLNINLDKTGTFTIYARSGSNTPRNIRFYTPGTQNAAFTSTDTVTNDSTVQSVTVNVTTAGEYNIGSNGGVYIYAIIFTPHISNDVKASTDAYQNGAKDALRIVGTISGVSDITTIKSIQLVLLKNDVATKEDIFITKCYTSVSGVGSYDEAENTYYVIYRITGINSTAMPDGTIIKHKLIVTFTDDSYVESTVVPSEWNN